MVRCANLCLLILEFLVFLHFFSWQIRSVVADAGEFANGTYVIEGTVIPPYGNDWFIKTRIHIDGGQYLGFVRSDGSFKVTNVPSGSYLVEVVNPVFVFQPARVDINSKGKIRARRFNVLQPNAVSIIPYPLEMASIGRASYFQPREQLRTLDLLMNPTLLLMIVPFLLIMLLPKLYDANDPELQREVQNLSILNPRPNLPDMSEVLTSMSLLGGKKPPDSRSRRVAALSASPNSLAADPDNQLCIGSIGSDGRHVSHSSMHISGGGSGNIAVGSGSVSGSGSELSHATSGNGTGGRRSGRKQRS